MSFKCKLNNTEEPHWVVNDYIALSDFQKSSLSSEGFMIADSMEGSVATLTIRVNATNDKNNTNLFCSSFSGVSSDRVVLWIIDGKL